MVAALTIFFIATHCCRSNPDLAERFAADAPLEPSADPSTWYTPDAKAPEKGYTDFPTAKSSKQEHAVAAGAKM